MGPEVSSKALVVAHLGGGDEGAAAAMAVEGAAVDARTHLREFLTTLEETYVSIEKTRDERWISRIGCDENLNDAEESTPTHAPTHPPPPCSSVVQNTICLKCVRYSPEGSSIHLVWIVSTLMACCNFISR